jgi:hypothetical protein
MRRTGNCRSIDLEKAKAEIQVRAGGRYRIRQSCRRLWSLGADEGKKKGRANFAPTFLDLPQRRLPVHPWSAVGDKLYE